MKNPKVIVIGAAALLVVAGIAVLGSRGEEKEPAASNESRSATQRPQTASGTLLPSGTSALPPIASAPRTTTQVARGDQGIRAEEEGINWYNNMNPEDQPRAFHVREFMGLASMPTGFQADGIILTADGLQLAPPAEGEEDLPRQGVLTSPAEVFDFPTNALAPFWLEDTPEGTDIMVEIQVSPDGVNWGPWQYSTIDNDSYGQIEPFFPDGRPNPQFGYTPGGLLVWGDLQFTEWRYRVTMFSESPATPTVQAIRAFYQDSTMGEGRIASVGEMEVDLISLAQDEDNVPVLEVHQQTPNDVSRP